MEVEATAKSDMEEKETTKEKITSKELHDRIVGVSGFCLEVAWEVREDSWEQVEEGGRCLELVLTNVTVAKEVLACEVVMGFLLGADIMVEKSGDLMEELRVRGIFSG